MTKVSYETFFSTLSNGRRLEVMRYLNNHGPKTVTEIVEGTKIEQSAVSHMLGKLQACEAVHVTVNGRQRTYSINSETISPLFKLIDQHIEKFCKSNCDCCSLSDSG